MKFSLISSIRWSILISGITFVLAAIFSVSSTAILSDVEWFLGMVVVLILILIGIFFDMIGLASAAAKETPFHAMAAEKVKGSKQGIQIIRNADRFSSISNDVIGDVTGVISGAAVILVVGKLMEDYNSLNYTILSVSFTSLVSALTVGGKAIGKSFAIHYAETIVLFIGKIFYLLEHKLHITVFKNKKKSNQGKRGTKGATR
ncbi:hypothetical protein [Longirhabdus pacifica]|uniref:hypothetical protein n=1 Tax=Longirhabdus pacifica TaxID=2305227 RepID=UPI001008CF53|nr:hypothetical protein [Longirhabdus pacifica]